MPITTATKMTAENPYCSKNKLSTSIWKRQKSAMKRRSARCCRWMSSRDSARAAITTDSRTAKRSTGKGPLTQPPVFLLYCPAPDERV